MKAPCEHARRLVFACCGVRGVIGCFGTCAPKAHPMDVDRDAIPERLTLLAFTPCPRCARRPDLGALELVAWPT